jgi:signal transduction histidine kinase
MRVCLLCLCCLLISVAVFAQPDKAYIPIISKRINLIAKEISACKEDTNKVLLYIELSRDNYELFTINQSYNKLNIQQSADGLAAAQGAWKLSNKLKYTHGLVLSTIMFGVPYEEIDKDYAKAIGYYKQAAKIAEANRLYADVNLAYGSILNMYYYTDDYPGAMGIVQKGIAVAGQQNDKAMLAHYYNQLGFIYLKQEKPAESIKYYNQYLALAIQTGDRMMLADAYNSTADAYLLEKNYGTSLHYLFAALDIYKKMDDIETINKKTIINKADRIPYTLFRISNACKLQGRYQLSLQYALKGFDYIKSRKVRPYNQYDLAGYYVDIGEVYMALNHYQRAIRFLNKGLLLSKSIMHREDMRDAYIGLSKTYALQKQYDSAYYYQQSYSVLKDSIISEKASRAIEQVRSSFESDKKDKEIALLKQQQRLKETEAENRTLLLNIVIGFFTLLAVISYLIMYIRNNRKKQRQVYEKQLAVQTERQRISGDMHDDIGTGLSTMLIYVNLLKSKLKGRLEYPDIERVASLGDGLVAQMKEIVWSLNPDNDSIESLLIFIRQYFVQLFDPLPYSISIVFPSSIPDAPLKGAIRRNIYLSIKEALNNVIKHANADCIELNVTLSQDKLIISIKDNGVGFPENSDSNFFSNGLKNMRRRMDQIGGTFQFYNEGGAIISIELALDGYSNG